MNKNDLLNSIFYPRKSNMSKNDKDFLIKTSDGEIVGARLFLKNVNFNTIIFYHGNAELAQEYDDIASYYNRYDLNFIVIDYRGYGLSTGSPSLNNLHEDANNTFLKIKEYLFNKFEHLLAQSLATKNLAFFFNGCKKEA